jgi:hypothetical protein
LEFFDQYHPTSLSFPSIICFFFHATKNCIEYLKINIYSNIFFFVGVTSCLLFSASPPHSLDRVMKNFLQKLGQWSFLFAFTIFYYFSFFFNFLPDEVEICDATWEMEKMQCNARKHFYNVNWVQYGVIKNGIFFL